MAFGMRVWPGFQGVRAHSGWNPLGPKITANFMAEGLIKPFNSPPPPLPPSLPQAVSSDIRSMEIQSTKFVLQAQVNKIMADSFCC